MTELAREAILSERSETLHLATQRLALRAMVRAKEVAESGPSSSTTTKGKRSGERERITTGASKSKSEGLERLRKRRADKSSGRKGGRERDREEEEGGGEGDAYSPARHSKALSDYTASSASEGEVEEGEGHLTSSRSVNKSPIKSSGSGGKKVAGEVLSPQDLRDCLVTRERLAGLVKAPWFGEWVVGTFFFSFLFFSSFSFLEQRRMGIDFMLSQ